MKTYKYTINGNKYEVAVENVLDNVATVSVNGEVYKVEIDPEVVVSKPKPVVRPAAAPAKPAAPAAQSAAAAGAKPASGQYAVKAPLPGVITEIKVACGDEVKSGDAVVVLEAMKMANNLETEKAGRVASVCVQPGQSVMEGDALVIIE